MSLIPSKTPHLWDVDADSLFEMLIVGYDRLFVLQSEGTYLPSQMPKPTYQYDKWRTGWYRLSPTGVEERSTLYASHITPDATIVRGVLRLRAGHDRNPPGDFGSCPRANLARRFRPQGYVTEPGPE